MSPPVLVLMAAVVAAAATLVVAGRGSRRGPSRRGPWPEAINHRGRPVPIVLGVAVVAGMTLGVGAGLLGDSRRHDLLPTVGGALGTLGAVLLVFAAGLFDDTRPQRTHGMRRQLGALLRGRPTSGIVKLVAIVAGAALFALAVDARGSRLWLGIPLTAGGANLWNLLDVVPGRSIKGFLPVAAALLVLCPTCGFSLFVAVTAGAALAALPFDLAEAGMLGDGGANVLGFVAGAGLTVRLSPGGLVVALVLVVTLHVLADTLTLSRLIDAAPPLRWLDRLGRGGEGRPGSLAEGGPG